MVKKLFFALILTPLLALLFSSALYASDVPEIVSVDIRMPEISVFCRIDGAVSVEDITATLGGRLLKTVSIGDAAGLPTTYYVLLDNSASLSDDFFEAEKTMIKAIVKRLSDSDRLILITFGETVSMELDGSENQNEIDEVVDALSGHSKYTKFYDAVDALVSHSDSVNEEGTGRKIAFIMSDGIDAGFDNSEYAEISNKITDAGIVMYGLCTDNYMGRTGEAMGAIVRASGGSLYYFKPDNAVDVLNEAFDRALDCSVIKLTASSNLVTGGSELLTLLIEELSGELSVSADVTPIRWIPDNTPPRLLLADYDKDRAVIRLGFDEPVNGADAADNYDVINEAGERVPVYSVRYFTDNDLNAENRSYAELLFSDTPENGTYSIRLKNIYDVSMEKNALEDESVSLNVKSGILTAAMKLALIITASAALIIAALLTVYLLFSKHRQEIPAKIQPQEAEAPAPVTVALGAGAAAGNFADERFDGCGCCSVEAEIYSGKRLIKKTVFYVSGGTCLGRADICEAAFDDPKMSRQHAMLEYENDRLYVTDLDSLNGTFVDGVKITGRYALRGDETLTVGGTTVKLRKITPAG